MGNNTLNLKVGDKIKIGKLCSKKSRLKAGSVIELVEGEFEYDNGLYCQDVYCPAIWDEEEKDFDSIFHLFGNNLENFMDCEIIQL